MSTGGRAAPTVLVVDDDPLIRFVVMTALTGSGYTGREAHDGATAVEIVRTDAIDIVILDARMPGQPLAETLTLLKEAVRPPGVILLSGDSHATLGPEAAGIEYLAKPVELPALLDAVSRLSTPSGPDS